MKRADVADARVLRTRRALRASLLALLTERGWEALRVSDVCERARVARSTFYTHFADKEELLLSGFDELHAELRAAARRDPLRPLGFVRPLIDHVREGYWSATRRRVRALSTGRGGQIVRERLTRMVCELLSEEVAAPAGPRREAAVRYLAGALVELLLCEPRASGRLSSEDLEALYRRLTLPVLHELLDEVRKTLGPLAARDAIEITVENLPEDLRRVAADRTRLVQILMNFGSNAIKYNRANGTVTFGALTVDRDRIRITVTDTGVGIAAEQHGRLFQPFQRAGQEMGPIEGTGIGLVITKRLAALMQGTVGFRSAVGEGSQFWIDLPIDAAAPVPDASVILRADGPTRSVGQCRRLVLYVEDNPANVRFMRDLVSSLDDIELVTASTAEMGVELACERLPDVIIMDINLPGMSGLDALRLLRGRAATSTIPVIALTAAASERDRQRGLAAGFCQYLTKPVRVDELVESLEALLTSRPLGPGA